MDDDGMNTPVRQASKVDVNHGQIRDELRDLGFVVFDIHALGRGYPDLHVSKGGWSILVEVKPLGRPIRLTHAEMDFQAQWQGPYIIAQKTEDVTDRYEYWLDQTYRPESPPAE